MVKALVALGALLSARRKRAALKVSSCRGGKPTAKRRRPRNSDDDEEEDSEANKIDDEDDRDFKSVTGNRNFERLFPELTVEPPDEVQEDNTEEDDEEAGPVSRTRAKVSILLDDCELL